MHLLKQSFIYTSADSILIDHLKNKRLRRKSFEKLIKLTRKTKKNQL